MSIEMPRLQREEGVDKILNIEWASDFLKKRGWKIIGMPGSGFEPLNGMHTVVNAKGEDTGIRFRPYSHTDAMHGNWYIEGRDPSEYPANAWEGRGWEPFSDIDIAIREMEYYRIHGIDFNESPSEAADRRSGARNP